MILWDDSINLGYSGLVYKLLGVSGVDSPSCYSYLNCKQIPGMMMDVQYLILSLLCIL